MTKLIVGSMSDWSGTLRDLFRQINDGSLALYQMQAFLEHRDPFVTLPDIPWNETYRALDMEDEYSQAMKTLQLSDRPELWVMPFVKGLTSSRIVAGCKKLGMNFYLYVNDLDWAMPKHNRDADHGSYVVGFHRTVEADEKNKNKSANQLAKENHKGITLPERLLLGAGFYVATGQHLDKKTRTLCSGSRDRDGDVPHVSWNADDRGVCVGWCSPGYCSGFYLRSRSAVSVPSCLRSEA